MVVVDAQFDQLGIVVEERWPLDEHPALQEAVESLQPVAARLDSDGVGPTVRALLEASGVTHGAWVPVCPNGELHGVLTIASRGAAIPDECVERCVALGHFLELALSNWAAHRKLKEQAKMEERRRIARELHDGLAHELAFIASKTRGAVAGAATSREAATWPARPTGPWTKPVGPSPCSRSQSRSRSMTPSHRRSRTSGPASVWRGTSSWPTTSTYPARSPRTCSASSGRPSPTRRTTERRSMSASASNGAGALRLVIEDDGCGFDPDRQVAAGGFGLLSMQERAARVGAVLSVDSVPEQERGSRWPSDELAHHRPAGR